MDTNEAMRAVMQGLERIFPNTALVLLAAPFGATPDARVNFISNGQREEIVVLMKEVIARFEGRRPDVPETRQ